MVGTSVSVGGMPPADRPDSIDRRKLLRGAGALAAAAQFGTLGGCSAAAQGDALESAVAALAGLDPLRPEEFGATGRAGDDQTPAFAALLGEARRRGRAHIELRKGATYALSNPHLFGGMRELLIEGNGATIMNARAMVKLEIFDSNFAPFRSPVPVLPNGIEPLDFGTTQGNGKLDLGMRIRSAARGATTLASFDGTPLPSGPLLVYGWDRLGFDSVPPCPMAFEWVTGQRIPGRPDQVRLAAPLRFDYDAQAPEVAYTNDRSQRYGAVRVFSLRRGEGRYRAFTELDLLALRDVRFAPSARITAPGQELYNGVAGFGGARRILLERVSARRMFVNFAELVRIRGSQVEQDFEIDKILGRVEIESSTIGALIGALGAREVALGPGTVITGGTALAPIDLLEARGARFSGDAMSHRALIGLYAHGSKAVRLESCTFVATAPQADRLVEAPFFEAAVRRFSRGELALSRAEYDRSGIFRNLFPGAALYDSANRKIGRVRRLPWCPDGDLLAGDVHIGIDELVPLAAAFRLRMPVIAGLTLRKAVIEGRYAAQVPAIFGTDPHRLGPSILAVVDGLEIGTTTIQFDSAIAASDRPGHTFLIAFGRSFVPAQLKFEIVKPAGSAAGSIFVGADKDTGGDIDLLRAVRATVGGARLLSATGRTLLAGDGAAEFPAGGLSAIRIIDPTRGLPAAARAHWKLTVQGSFR